jgi:transcriptional regulator with XRE-family HTH domain
MTPSDIGRELAKRLTAVRLQKAWTREVLAKISGVNVHSLKRFERTGQVSLERLIAVSQALGLHAEIERLFKPRQRVDIENWGTVAQPARKRGKRNQTVDSVANAQIAYAHEQSE